MKMTKSLKQRRAARPERSFKTALEGARERDKGEGQDGVRKRVTNVSTALKVPGEDGEQKHADGVITSMSPNAEQMAKINQFTRSEKTADDVAAFTTLSCNDLLDRDIDAFTTNTVKEFAALGGALTSVGKSFMVGHDYSKMPIGRIFDVETKAIDGTQWLTNDVYIPRTSGNQELIEGFDFGINWAVSVGVMLGANDCSVCEGQMSRMGFCYDEGHIKGYSYEKDHGYDDFGWAEPADENSKSARLCFGEMKDARDFYELSSVFLGAQYFAAVDEKQGVGGIIKAASAAGIPILSLGRDETDELKIPHLPKQVKEAQEKYTVSSEDDGSLTWDDDTNVRWVFDPEDGEVKSLGRTSTKETQHADTDTINEPGEPGDTPQQRQPSELLDGSGNEGLGTQLGVVPDADHEHAKGVLGGAVPRALSAELTASLYASDGLGVSLGLSKVDGEELEGFLVRAAKQAQDLRFKAELGDSYIKEMRSEAIDWYVRAHQSDGEPVSVATFEKLLNLAGSDTELIKELSDEQKKAAQARFPQAARRSSFEADHNKGSNGEDRAKEMEKEIDRKNSSDRVSRLHG